MQGVRRICANEIQSGGKQEREKKKTKRKKQKEKKGEPRTESVVSLQMACTCVRVGRVCVCVREAHDEIYRKGIRILDIRHSVGADRTDVYACAKHLHNGSPTYVEHTNAHVPISQRERVCIHMRAMDVCTYRVR